ncbi:MAG: SMC family ATPase, partial [Anaerolineae bacterium]|nr:SMC family ATPase [Anaerolineae bacterium]
FVSALDEREYEVVRHVGGSSQSFVYDSEIGRKLCEGREDTLVFIREHLNLDAETNLTTLFEDAIGVPQGTMTAAFRERPADRKQKFNRLLHIDMYEQAWTELLKTGNYIRELIAENDREQSELRGMLREKPAVEAAIADQSTRIAQEETRLGNLRGELDEASAALAAADALKGQLDGLDSRLSAAQEALARQQFRLDQAQIAHGEAVDAAAIVQETYAAHQAYELARQGLDAAEADREARDRLRDTLGDLTVRQEIAGRSLERAQDELEAVDAAEAQLEALAPLVVRQEALEQALGKAREAGQARDRLASDLGRQRERLEMQARRLEPLLAAAPLVVGERESAPVPETSAPLDELIMQAADVIGDLGRVLEQWEGAQQSCDTARQEAETIQERVARRAALAPDLAAREESLRDLEQQISQQQGRLNQARHDLDQLAEHEALLSTTGATCPVCRQPVDSHAQTEAQAHYSAERERLAVLIAQVEGALADLEAQAAAVENDRAALEKQLRDLPQSSAQEAAQDRLAQAETALATAEIQVQATVQESRAALAAAEAQLAVEMARLKELEEQGAAYESLQAELDALEDPRAAQVQARLVAARRDAVAQELTQARQEMEAAAEEGRQAEAQMAQFDGLDAQLAGLRQQLAENEADHTRYLAHANLAEQVEARQQVVDELAAELAEQADNLQALEEERAGLAQGYDARQHADQREAQRRLLDEELVLNTRLEGLRGTLAAEQQRLADMEEYAHTLGGAEAAAQRLETRQAAFEFVRRTVREAGPQITRQMVQVISEQANHIFGDLLGDHSYILSWSEDYGITVNSRGEVREFELLSGGEQMVAAMAVRLALLTQLANVRFAFFDEPTTNLDDTRRAQLAASLAEMQSLRQLFVISHDDTFEQESYHVIQVYKEQDLSQVEML